MSCINSLFSLSRRRAVTATNLQSQAERERKLFRFWDGSRDRAVDPWACHRKLHQHPAVNLETILPLANDGKEPEVTQLIELVCEVFGVVRYDEDAKTGLTDGEIFGVLDAFYGYLDSVKKNANPGPTSSVATA